MQNTSAPLPANSFSVNNYEYIIASLPVLQADYRGPLDAAVLLEEIREQLSGADAAALQFVLDGWTAECLTEEFYEKAAKSRSSFIKGYFLYDLQLRNAKVAWLNKVLGRPEDQDLLPCPDEDFEDAARVAEVLSGTDILARERGLDALLWERIDSLTVMHVFDLDLILGFAARLQIVNRWLRLDEATGRELFEKMVRDIKANYTLE